MAISKKDAIQPFGTQQALADALEISRSAVAMWPEDKPIPEKHELKLRYVLRPDLFGETTQHPKVAA